MIEAALHGFVLALGLILPLGVQNIFIFNQGATQRKFRQSLPAILTAAICDSILILLAVLGVSIFLFQLEWLKMILIFVGVCFLLYMGWITWKSKPKVAEAKALSGKKQVLFAMSVSLLNPHAILDTVGVIGTSSLLYDGTEKYIFTLLCILVSWIWFLSLGIAGRTVGIMDKSGKFLVVLNKVSAIVMWIMAIILLLSL